MSGSAAADDSSEVSPSSDLDDEVFGGYLAVLGNRGRPSRAALIAEKFRPPPVLYPVDDEDDTGADTTTAAGAAALPLELVARPIPVVPALFAEVGFDWAAGLQERDLAAMSSLERCHAHVDPSRMALQVRYRLRSFYRSGLGSASPAWWGAVRRRRQLTVLLAPAGTITRGDGGLSLGNAVHARLCSGRDGFGHGGHAATPTAISSVFRGMEFREPRAARHAD